MNRQAAMQAQRAEKVTSAPRGMLQRRCACGNHAAGGECEECRRKNQAATLQRAATNAAPMNQVPPIVHDVLGSPGRPLDAATRAFMEPRFGQDFSHVRVHTDARAVESAQAVNALAYTAGQDVVFGRGQYVPGTTEGQRLLAHELTHVVQQAQGMSSLQSSSMMSKPGDPAEHEAERVAAAVGAGREIPMIALSGGGIQRQLASECTYGEIREWAISSQSNFSPPAGLGDAKTSIGAACAHNPCNCVDGSHATAPGDQHAWQNIVAASGTNQTGGGTLMCVGTENCTFVHQCTRCANGHPTVVERAQNLAPTGTVTVTGKGTLYFYSDPLQGWCNAQDRQTACHPPPPPHGQQHGHGH